MGACVQYKRLKWLLTSTLHRTFKLHRNKICCNEYAHRQMRQNQTQNEIVTATAAATSRSEKVYQRIKQQQPEKQSDTNIYAKFALCCRRRRRVHMLRTESTYIDT